ncbi:hypothetical protein CONPUDRAFT_52726 [Coniophora puteana RWD-64-598 SS2]|uniref:Uncharacterized protein n=1 Tax=Coniophora puteana (strain RWD-64-598) TaxID=741705 RepID=A0A5M3MVA3_CONPW|nr:uncharacterized protein CONPUDRAFT_52726 [Coniophora puteana RWD-64-598 SS2]EIW82937.1 hypothetical protein CONPUDRAFT_52726 [Coniophora puteana RWD-64-598 SS2]
MDLSRPASSPGPPSPEHVPERDIGGIPASFSLLSARRPSWAPPLPSDDPIATGLASYRDVSNLSAQAAAAAAPSSLSPDDGRNFRRNLQIDMKDLVGDAVGNMSISPTSRDVVLAARRGLFIIDLEAPLEVPHFLPQGGTWDVADVQWNPHKSFAKYIVSTSSEKLLIWNLMLGGKTAIEHILRAHYRAITDLNWHTSEPETVCSVGIDSWLWTWDLRSPRKPAMGNNSTSDTAGGTQVKWNRHDSNILASSHNNEVLIWDRRKGSVPMARVKAHSSKIYGIDWSHSRGGEIITCSLDKTIKVWDLNYPVREEGQYEPRTTITTGYPVWRARDLPFGRGILSLPQRGDTTLEMYAAGNPNMPIEVFEGHTDVVKEFVWRKGDGGEYQLITWSKDRTLRFWPVDADIMERAGHIPSGASESRFFTDFDATPSTRFVPHPTTFEHQPQLSAPIGSRAILAGVRAGYPHVHRKTSNAGSNYNPVLQPHRGSALRERGNTLTAGHIAGAVTGSTLTFQNHPRATPTNRNGGTMSRGGGINARVDKFAWLSSVKVGEKREDSSGPDSGGPSRLSSRSRPSSGREQSVDRQVQDDSGRGRSMGHNKRRRSESKDRREGEGTQSLQDEITSVLTKLTTQKVKLEKHDLAKRRTCTLGLHGPWGDNSSVFIRVTLKFPKAYPASSHPDATPELEMERNPLISMQTRAFMLRRLRGIRERRRPCLEACLRFLLFGDEDEHAAGPMPIESESSDEDGEFEKPKDLGMMRVTKNIMEPRTSQGVFGPNGELVCFFRAAPRMVKTYGGSGGSGNDLPASNSTAAASRSSTTVPRIFQSPALLSDAVRRLGVAASDSKQLDPYDTKRSDKRDDLVRLMTNLLTFATNARGKPGESTAEEDSISNYSYIPTRRSILVLKRPPPHVFKIDREAAARYVYEAESLAKLCEANAKVASEFGLFHHERVFSTIRSLFPASKKKIKSRRTKSSTFTNWGVAQQTVQLLYQEFSVMKDVQMLAMISVILLKAAHVSISSFHFSAQSNNDPMSAIPKVENDYFSLARQTDNRAGALSPAWPRLPLMSPTANILPAAPPISTSNSSKGSWSSLFNTGSMRNFMANVQESIGTPMERDAASATLRLPIPVPQQKEQKVAGSDSPRRRKVSKETTASVNSPVSKSWSEAVGVPKPASSGIGGNQGYRPTFSRVISPKRTIPEKKLVITEEAEPSSTRRPLDARMLKQLSLHIHAYAEILFRWQLLNKRTELLNAVPSGKKTSSDLVLGACLHTSKSYQSQDRG